MSAKYHMHALIFLAVVGLLLSATAFAPSAAAAEIRDCNACQPAAAGCCPSGSVMEQECRYWVARPVCETVEREERYTTRRPVCETHEREETYCVKRPVVETYLRREQHTVYDPVTTCETRCVKRGLFKSECALVPVTRLVARIEMREVPTQRVRYVEEQQVRKVPIRTCRMVEEEAVRMRPVTTCRTVYEERIERRPACDCGLSTPPSVHLTTPLPELP